MLIKLIVLCYIGLIMSSLCYIGLIMSSFMLYWFNYVKLNPHPFSQFCFTFLRVYTFFRTNILLNFQQKRNPFQVTLFEVPCKALNDQEGMTF